MGYAPGNRASNALRANAEAGRKVRQLSSKILFELVCGLEPRLKKLDEWYYSLCTTIEKWSANEGDQGVKRAKTILNQGWLAILNEKVTDLEFVKQEKGIPVLVKPLVDRVKALKPDARLLSAVLSLVRVTDLWYGQCDEATIQNTLDTIQNSVLPTGARKVIDDFCIFCRLFVENHPSNPIVQAYEKALSIGQTQIAMYRESRGPNGNLTANAHKDVMTLLECYCSDGNNLLSWINRLESEICRNAIQTFSPGDEFRTRLTSEQGLCIEHANCPGKMSLISEKSGKCRLVASPDYYSQVALSPLHDWLEGILRAFSPMDCTFDQRSAIPRISEWQSEGREIYSFDQSSCTDLFPFEMQLKLIENRFGSALSEAVQHVMADRVWELRTPKGSVKKVRWSVGQPMGLMGSWPLMAVTHHFLVQYSYWKSSGKQIDRFKPYTRYVICGDDIVIGDKSVAEYYLKVVKQLGMKINLTKSHITGGLTGIDPVSEFAKITVWRGQPLYPIRPNMVKSAVKDWRYAVPLLQDISMRPGFALKQKQALRIINTFFPKGRKYLVPLLTVPSEFGGVGFRDTEPLKKKFFNVRTKQIHPWLVYLAMKVRSGLVTEVIKPEVDMSNVIDDIPNRRLWEKHPLLVYLNEVEQRPSNKLIVNLGFGDIRPPQVSDIIEDMCFVGTGRFDNHTISRSNGCVPPHLRNDVTTKDLENLNLWQRALRKPYYLPDLTKFNDFVQYQQGFYIHTGYRLSGSASEFSNSTFSSIDEALDAAFKATQYRIVVSSMLGVRMNNDNLHCPGSNKK